MTGKEPIAWNWHKPDNGGAIHFHGSRATIPICGMGWTRGQTVTEAEARNGKICKACLAKIEKLGR